MTSASEVELFFDVLRARFDDLDEPTRARLPSRRIIEARCDDLGLVYHAILQNGALSPVAHGRPARADVQVSFRPDDLRRLLDGQLDVGGAWASGRLRVRASAMDLLRLRMVL